jgi:hypothetical protein
LLDWVEDRFREGSINRAFAAPLIETALEAEVSLVGCKVR